MGNRNRAILVLVSAVLLGCSKAQAAEVSFVPNGDSSSGVVKGEIGISWLGSTPLKNGTLMLNDKVASIKILPEFSDTPRTVLAGSILRAEASGSGTNATVTGIVAFLMGDWMSKIDDEAQQDVIFKSDGQVRGRIIGREGDALVVQGQNGVRAHVPLATMLYIRSPRVFVFNLSARSAKPVEKDTPLVADVLNATIRPTSTPRAVSLSSVVPKPQGQDDGIGGVPATLSPSQLFDQDDLPSGNAPSKKQYTPFIPSWLPQ